jgi:PAS domain S-box-containing protein
MQISLIGAGATSKSGIRSGSWRKVLLVLLAISALASPATAQATQKNVLVLSGGRGRVSINQMETSLRAHFSGPVNFSIVDLENPRFEQKSYRDNLAKALRAAYSSEKLSLVVAVMTWSLEFAVQYRDKVFPGVPIVFMSNISPLPEKMWPGVTGVQSATGVQETIDLALRLQADTQAVAVISKASGPDNDWFQAEHSELLRHRDKVKEIDLLGPASPELLQRVAELPPHTVVLFQLYPEDANQPAFGALDVLAAVAERFPTYSILPFITVGRGGVGGASYDPRTDADLAGQLAARVLSGEKVENIPVVQNSKAPVSVDWRQLHRWNIPESSLPPGTRVLFREPTLWEQGREYFLPGIGVIVGQSLLIFGLFWQRARKRKAESVLRESEKRFRVMADTTPSLIWMCDEKGKIIYLNRRSLAFTGSNAGAGHGDSWIGNVHLDDRKNLLDVLSLSLESHEGFSQEYRLRRQDGVYRWMYEVASPRFSGDGSFSGFISSAIDITEQKLDHQALEKVSGRLIEAQETERTRIARELHDDINQRLAMVAVSLRTLKRDLPDSEVKTSRRIEQACEQVSDLENDIQALSHRLHSSKLEYLGLEAATSSFCTEVTERQNVKIDFRCDGLPGELPSEVSLCLFRVLQEALHNAVKYSGVDELEVSLAGVSHGIQLRVHDSGAGFDPMRTGNGHGLGLTSMKERLRLVSGELSIDSKPGQGTTILALVPLAGDAGAAASGMR